MIALLPTHKTILTHVDFSKTWTVESQPVLTGAKFLFSFDQRSILAHVHLPFFEANLLILDLTDWSPDQLTKTIRITIVILCTKMRTVATVNIN